MDYHVFKSYLNRYYSKHVGGQQREVFFNIKNTFPTLNQLSENYPAIKREFDQIFQQNPNMPLYHEIDPGEKEISSTTEKNWKVFMLYLLGHKPKTNRNACPETCHILDNIPGLVQAFFSVLEPGKSIPLHEGPYLGYLRYHLGIQIPKENPPRLYVNGQEYIWQEGKGLLFDDSWPHSVVNISQEVRVVLIVDVLRPMPFVPTFVNKLMTGLLAKYTYGRRVMGRIKGYTLDDKPIIT
jgi:aspartate beta-hydroxylase